MLLFEPFVIRTLIYLKDTCHLGINPVRGRRFAGFAVDRLATLLGKAGHSR